MSTSILSRSVVALATLAVGAATFAAAPANAATPSAAVTPAGVTRETVLNLAAAMRTPGESSFPVAMKAARSILNRACQVDGDNGEALVDVDEPSPVAASTNADGVLVTGTILNFADESTRQCAVAAVAATAPGFTLVGTASLTVVTESSSPSPGLSIAAGPTTVTSALSNDVSTIAFLVPAGEELANNDSMSATGSSVKVTKVTTTKKVTDKKTKAEKKAAKKAYAKKLASLKKAQAKALKKAGSNKAKKSAAKKAYAAKKKAAKAKYTYAVANYKLVKKTTSVTDSRPFTIATPLL